jgi:hypothetical protein
MQDRETILQTSRSWKLADLDVSAFSYAPIPYTVENRLGRDRAPQAYLLDNTNRPATKGPMSLKDKTMSEEWSLINNQIFLGVLGSLIIPRKEIQLLLSTLSDAGVRFVYFSPVSPWMRLPCGVRLLPLTILLFPGTHSET